MKTQKTAQRQNRLRKNGAKQSNLRKNTTQRQKQATTYTSFAVSFRVFSTPISQTNQKMRQENRWIDSLAKKRAHQKPLRSEEVT